MIITTKSLQLSQAEKHWQRTAESWLPGGIWQNKTPISPSLQTLEAAVGWEFIWYVMVTHTGHVQRKWTIWTRNKTGRLLVETLLAEQCSWGQKQRWICTSNFWWSPEGKCKISCEEACVREEMLAVLCSQLGSTGHAPLYPQGKAQNTTTSSCRERLGILISNSTLVLPPIYHYSRKKP